MWIQSNTKQSTYRLQPFEGFYIEYPDDQRPDPAPLGLVSKVASDPPLMNWIYIDRDTCAIRHGNRTESRPHRVGDWGFSNDDEDDFNDDEDPGGIEFDGEERFVAVGPEPKDTEGRWEVWWDEYDNHLQGRPEVKGRKVFGISLEREFVKEDPT